MAVQRKNVPFSGKIGDLVYYTSEGKQLVRRAPSVDRERLASEPGYAGMRETNFEFGQLAKAGKLIRETLLPFIRNACVNRLSAHVNSLLSRIKNSDSLPRGKRTVAHALQGEGQIGLLNGFEFNRSPAQVRLLLNTAYTIDPVSCELIIPEWNAGESVSAPKAATHVQLTYAIARLDFHTAKGELHETETQEFELTSANTSLLAFRPAQIPGNGVAVCLLRINFLTRLKNGQVYPVRNGHYDSAAILKALS